MTLNVKTAFLGRVPYQDAWNLQKTLAEEVSVLRDEGYILFLEHDPVITLGRSGTWDHLLQPKAAVEKMGVSLVECDRGGDITVHYPGQLVTYPILPMEHLRQNIHWFLRCLEDAGIRTAARLGIVAGRKQGLTGVWAGEKKIMAIGVGFRRWVSYHGTAFNVKKDPGIFDLIVPCGIKDKGVTSVEELTGALPALPEVASKMKASLQEVFGIRPVEVPSEEIWAVSRHGS